MLSLSEKILQRQRNTQNYAKLLESRRQANNQRKAAISDRYKNPAVQNYRAQADLKDQQDAARGPDAIRTERLADRANIAQRNDEAGFLLQKKERNRLRLSQIAQASRPTASLRDQDLAHGTFPNVAASGKLNNRDLAGAIRAEAEKPTGFGERATARAANARRQRQGVLGDIENRGSTLAAELRRRQVDDANRKFDRQAKARAVEGRNLESDLLSLGGDNGRIAKAGALQAHADFLAGDPTGIDATGNSLVAPTVLPNSALPISAVAAATRQKQINEAQRRGIGVNDMLQKRREVDAQMAMFRNRQGAKQAEQRVAELQSRRESLVSVVNSPNMAAEGFNNEQTLAQRQTIMKQIQAIDAEMDELFKQRQSPQVSSEGTGGPSLTEVAAALARQNG